MPLAWLLPIATELIWADRRLPKPDLQISSSISPDDYMPEHILIIRSYYRAWIFNPQIIFSWEFDAENIVLTK
jgi:hypothetical protein